jgi:hypothetical protein
MISALHGKIPCRVFLYPKSSDDFLPRHFAKPGCEGEFYEKVAQNWAKCMMYPRFFAQIVGRIWNNLQKDVCRFTIESQKVPQKKGRKQAIFGGRDYGTSFTGSPHAGT